MQSSVEEIKSRVDIADVVQSYIKLEKAGVNYKAVCPFHAERTPSFFVNPARQIWHCFGGCSIGGDIFSFVMKIEGIEFPEALEILARRAGIELKREDPRFAYERKKLYEISEAAAIFFQKRFKESEAVKKYMKERGVGEESLDDFRVGFAPDGWRNLLEHLTGRGFKAEDIEKAGLVIKREQDTRYKGQDASNYYDRFRNRIIFPINDSNGRVIGFGGRIFELETGNRKPEAVKTEAKYINSPQTLIYDKSRVLFALDKAKQEIRKKNECVLVEGYMDAVMSHQAGLKNTVAVSGTALTDQQLDVIKRLTNVLVSFFDEDQSGNTAAFRSLDLAARHDFERKAAIIPSGFGKDPADVVLKDADELMRIVENAKEVFEFYFDKAFANFDSKTPSQKKKIFEFLKYQLKIMPNAIERADWVKKISSRFGFAGGSSWGEGAIWEELQKNDDREKHLTSDVGKTAETEKRSRKQELEEKLLGMLLLHPQKISLIEIVHIESYPFSHEKAVAAYSYIAGRNDEATPLDREYYDHLKFKTEIFLEGISDIDKEIKICFNEFLRESIKEKLGTLSQRIISAEKEKNQETLSGLMQEFQTLSNKFHSL